MYLYHFTRLENVVGIKARGIDVGITPFSKMTGNKAVSLTRTPSHQGLGLIKGGVLTEGVDPEFAHMAENFPNLIAINSLGTREIHLFDQTEARIKVNLNKASSKLLDYNKLFEKEIVNNVYRGYSRDAYKRFKAVGIHSADYPYSTSHLAHDVIDREVEDIVSGKRRHNAKDWFFFFGIIPPKKIVEILIKQPDGNYA